MLVKQHCHSKAYLYKPFDIKMEELLKMNLTEVETGNKTLLQIQETFESLFRLNM